MDNAIYKIRLADGTEIDGLRLNGNNFVSLVEIDSNIFANNTTPVVIEKTEDEKTISEEHPFMELVQITKMEGEHWFILRDIPAKELADMKLRSDVEYIALMADIKLED